MSISLIKKIPPHLWVAASAWGARFVSVGVQLYSVRYMLKLLGHDGYAMFSLLAGLLAWASLADFGMGSSLQNHISERRAEGRPYASIVVSSLFSCIPILFIFGFFLFFSSGFLSRHYLQGVLNVSGGEKESIFFMALMVFVITALAGVSYRILFSEQKGWVSNLLPAIAGILGLFSVLVYECNSDVPSVRAVFFCFYAPSAVAPIFLSAWIVLKNWHKFNRIDLFSDVIFVFNRGFGFWFFSILATLVLQADFLVLSQKMKPSDIVLYSILTRVFGLISFVYAAVLQALWPVCTELRVRNEWNKVYSYVSRYMTVGALLVVVSTIAFWFSRNFVFHVLGANVEVSFSTVFLFGFYYLIRVWTDTYAMLLQSMNHVKPLWLYIPFQALISFLAQWFFADMYGVNGLLLGLILSFLLTAVFVLPISFRRRVSLILTRG